MRSLCDDTWAFDDEVLNGMGRDGLGGCLELCLVGSRGTRQRMVVASIVGGSISRR